MVVREDLIGNQRKECPAIFDFKVGACKEFANCWSGAVLRARENHGIAEFRFFFQLMNDNESLYNTPPTWSIYITKLFLDWLMTEGGMKHFETLSQQKSEMIYDIIDSSQNFYR